MHVVIWKKAKLIIDKTLFPPKCQITQVDLADGNYKDVDNDKVTGTVDEANDGSDSSDAEEDKPNEMDDEWGTLYTDESKGIFKSLL